VAGRTLLFDVRAADGATVERPELRYELWTAEPLEPDVVAQTAGRIGAFLSIDDDLGTFYDRARGDPVLSPHVERLYGLHQVRFLTPFENGCWAVMGQRTPIAIARRAKDAFVERYGGTISVDGVTYRAFPEPDDVAGLTPDDLRPIVRDDRRAAYLANVINAWRNADERWLRAAPFDEAEAWLRSIKGFGEWSTLFVLFRGLGRGDRMTLTRPNAEAMRGAYGELSDDELQAILDGYGAWAGYVLLYLRASR
jgi:DNA-3-methyladenine glycosylase II